MTQQLREDLSSHRLAGIFMGAPTRSLPVIKAALGKLPTAGLVPAHVGRDQVGDMVRFTLSDQWLEVATDHVASQGCKRIAVITSGQQGPEFVERALSVIRRRGLETRTAWIQACWPGQAAWARHCVHLLFDGHPADGPDALLITDDSLVEESIGGLIDVGVSVPDQVRVVGHCNYPWVVPSVLPVRRLGYDIGEMLEQAIKIMHDNRDGCAHRHDVEMAVQWEQSR